MSADAALLEFLDRHQAELLEFTRTLIATPSVNPPGNEREVASVVRDRLGSLGIDQITEHSMQEDRPNLIARLGAGVPGPTLMFNGHLDTKPAGDLDAWDTDPWDPVVRNGELVGLGSGDMKAAVAAMVYAAGALRQVGPPSGTLVLTLVADEEAGSDYGARWLAQSGLLEADAAVIGEPCGISREFESIDLISRGAILFKVTVKGTQMHSSLSDRLPAVNATVMAARLMDRMYRELKSTLTVPDHPLADEGPTVNVGVTATAGVFYGVYPGEAEFGCDIRVLPGMTEEQVVADIQAFINRVAEDEPELDAELTVDGWFPATEIGPEEPIAEAVRSAAETVLGRAPPFGAFPGATDAAHIQGTAGIPTVAAFGPGYLPRAHSPNESLGAESVLIAAKVYALAAWRYLNRS